MTTTKEALKRWRKDILTRYLAKQSSRESRHLFMLNGIPVGASVFSKWLLSTERFKLPNVAPITVQTTLSQLLVEWGYRVRKSGTRRPRSRARKSRAKIAKSRPLEVSPTVSGKYVYRVWHGDLTVDISMDNKPQGLEVRIGKPATVAQLARRFR